MSQVVSPVQTSLPPPLALLRCPCPFILGSLELTSKCCNNKAPGLYFSFSSEALLVTTLLLTDRVGPAQDGVTSQELVFSFPLDSFHAPGSLAVMGALIRISLSSYSSRGQERRILSPGAHWLSGPHGLGLCFSSWMTKPTPPAL